MRSVDPLAGRRIADWDGPRTGFVITDSVAYLDSLTLFCWRPFPAGVLGSLRNQYGRRLIVQAHAWNSGRSQRAKRYFVTLHQPKSATLVSLNALQRTFAVHAAHVAIDFLCSDSREAELATAFLTCRVVQKWRSRRNRSHLELNTRYWNRNNKAVRNVALYGDRRSKTQLGPCAHFELRFTGAQACKRAGLHDLSRLAHGLDTLALLNRQTKIACIDPRRVDRALEKSARMYLPKTRLRYPHVTVSTIKERLEQLLVRCLQDEEYHLDAIARARSQSLWDHRPQLRSCVTRLPWTGFAPTPRWYRW